MEQEQEQLRREIDGLKSEIEGVKKRLREKNTEVYESKRIVLILIVLSYAAPEYLLKLMDHLHDLESRRNVLLSSSVQPPAVQGECIMISIVVYMFNNYICYRFLRIGVHNLQCCDGKVCFTEVIAMPCL